MHIYIIEVYVTYFIDYMYVRISLRNYMARVLIVDDSTIQRTILRKFLERENHEIVGEAITGQPVLELYKELNPDIVILDIILPDANGITILDQLMHYDRNANIIMCSATAMQNIIIESIKLGAKGFLVKPITGEALLKTVNKVLQMVKIVQEN